MKTATVGSTVVDVIRNAHQYLRFTGYSFLRFNLEFRFLPNSPSTHRRTRYLALQDIRGSISETKSPAGPVLWTGLKHWLSDPSEPLSIDTSPTRNALSF